MNGGVCTVEYRPPDSTHPNMLRFKGFELPNGKHVELPGQVAAHAVAMQPGVVLIDGKLPPYVHRTATARQELRRQREIAEDFPKDPAAVITIIPELSAELRKALLEKGAPDQIEAGKVDGDLVWVAMWARLGGLDAVAKAAIRRAEALRLKAD